MNLDPSRTTSKIRWSEHRLAKVFDHGLNQVVSYVLPLQAQADASRTRWESDRWELRRGTLVPVAGRFVRGLSAAARLAAVGRAEDVDPLVELDPFAPRAPLPPRHADSPAASGDDCERGLTTARPTCGRRRAPARTAGPSARASGVSSGPRSASSRATARLHVFLPPQRLLEDYLDWSTPSRPRPRSSSCRSCIEGYPPPADHRLNHFSITPDPGVIEVNIHPSHLGRAGQRTPRSSTRRPARPGWGPRSSCSTAGTPAPAAATTSSSAARRPADSPVLRRPDLLRSLVAYWHNHPSLSYLFSGLFVGPAQPGARGSTRRATTASTSWRSPSARFPTRRRLPALAGGPRLPPPAGGRDRQHAPGRVLHRQAVHPRLAPAAGSGWSSCGPSRCRRTPG